MCLNFLCCALFIQTYALFATALLSGDDSSQLALPRSASREIIHVRRQQDGAITDTTTVAYCYDSDALLLTGSGGSTFQIQCDTPYTGTTLSVVDSDSLAACIASCLEDICVGVTFGTAVDDDTPGRCTTYSEITGRSATGDPGIFSDSALLVVRSDGVTVAVPGELPTAAGSAASVSIPITTSLTSRSAVLDATMSMDQSSSVAMITNGGMRPVTQTDSNTSPVPIDDPTGYPLFPSGTSGTSESSISPTSPSVISQATFTTLFFYTKYLVQTVDICTAGPTACSMTIQMATKISPRTGISCSPGPCTKRTDLGTVTEVCVMPL